MSELYAYSIYRTETIEFKGEAFTVNFMKRKDGEEYKLIAVNDEGTKRFSGEYSRETADAFENINGSDLADEVYVVLRARIESNAG